MELIIILLLVSLNGVFAMAELSLVSARKFKLENAKKRGSSRAKAALELSENPNKFLSTVQIGITLIGILLGVYSGKSITIDIADKLKQFDVLNSYADRISVLIVVICITFLSIVLGELFPKRLAMAYPETIAMLIAKPMKWLSLITSPFVWLLVKSNDILLHIFNIQHVSENKVSEEEIKSIIKDSADGGEIQNIEQNIVERVFELGDRKINALFTHRIDVVFFSVNESYESVKHKINEEKHSAYPVTEGPSLDNVVGIILLKDLFLHSEKDNFDIQKYMRKPLFINENTYAYVVLELFRKERMHYGIVIDEYGTTLGIVTMDDVMDALIGEMSEEHHNEYQIVQRNETSWLVDGQYSISEFLKDFELDISDDYSDKFNTVAGLIISINNTLPDVGEKFNIGGFSFEVVDKDGQRIDKILVEKL